MIIPLYTLEQLTEKIKDLTSLLESLEVRMDDFETWWRECEDLEEIEEELPAVQLVKEVTKPEPVSEPISFEDMWARLTAEYSAYIEENDVYSVPVVRDRYVPKDTVYGFSPKYGGYL